jgi:hypothetical protein
MSGDTYAISGLMDKRKTLSGQVEYHRDQIKQVKSDLDTIDRAIKVFDPNIDLRTLKPKKMKGQCRFFKHGEATTLLMDLMREADRALTTTAIVNESARRKELSFDDIDRRTFTASIFSILKRLESNEVVKQVGKEGVTAIWTLC